MEPEIWTGLSDICRREHASLNERCTVVAGVRPDHLSLTAAIRVFVMAYFRAAATEDRNNRVGHGRGAVMLNQPMPAALIPASHLATPPAHNPNLMGYPSNSVTTPANTQAQTTSARPQQTGTSQSIPYMMGGTVRR